MPALTHQLLDEWRSPVQQHGGDELVKLQRVTEACKSFLRLRFLQSIKDAANRPLLLSYSADGTPVRTKVNITQRSESSSCRRGGYGTKEYYVQNCFLMFRDESGGLTVRALLRDPIPMTEGKTVRATAAMAVDFVPNPRAFGHAGLIVRHAAFDRAQFAPLQKLLRQWHIRESVQSEFGIQGTPPELLFLLDWSVQTPCSLHDVHKSFSWSMHSSFNSAELLKNVFISVESCRNCFKQICDYAPKWLWERLVLEADDNLEPPDDLRDMWLACGVDAELLIELVELRLLFRKGNIVVSKRHHDGKLFDRVMLCLFSLWHLRKFSESRWASVGTSCRANVAARLSGLPDLIQRILAGAKDIPYHLQGFQKAGEAEREFIVVAGLSSYPADAALINLAEDSRVPKRLAHLVGAVADEVRMLDEIRGPVWELLASVCAWSGSRLRSAVIAAAHCSVAGMHERVFSQACKDPWRLTVGDVDSNLQKLLDEPEPAETTAAKAWRLMRMGWNLASVKEAVVLLGELSWSTKVVEEQHSSASLMAKYHPEMAEDAVCARAFVHTCRNILPGVSEAERHLARLQARLSKLRRKRPQNFGARQLYVKDLVELGKVRKEEGKSAPDSGKVIARHGHLWKQVSAQRQQKYAMRAQLCKSRSSTELGEATQELEERCNIEQSRIQQEMRADRQKVLLSSVKLDKDDFFALDQLFNNETFGNLTRVRELRATAMKAPPRLPEALMKELAAIKLFDADPASAMSRPEWLAPLCHNRDIFSNSALAFHEGGSTRYFKFMYIKQSPHFIMFAPLKAVEVYAPATEVNHTNWEDLALATWRATFEVADFTKFAAWYELPQVLLSRIAVLHGLSYVGGSTLCSDVPEQPLGEVLAQLPVPAAKGRATAAAGTKDAQASLLAKYPWLSGSLEEEGARAGQPGPSKAQKLQHDEPELCDDLAQEDYDAVFLHLQRAREEAEEEEGAAPDDFRVRVLGGTWSVASKGVALAAYSAEARPGEPAAWAAAYHFGLTARFEVSIYTATGAACCARAWCAKAQYFYNIYVNSGDENYEFSSADVEGWKEPKDLTSLAAGLAVPRALRRFAWLRALRPRK